MAMSAYPTSLDTLTNPGASSKLNNPSHSQQHSDANDAIEALEAKVGINGSAVTTSVDYKLSSLPASTKAASYNCPQGFLLNGKLSVTVASNNITVAIKTLAGANPSATDPVYCRIGDTIRTISAALSVTKNAATNWFNAGSAELATKEIDYFAYLGYNSTDGVVIGFARTPNGTQYSSFSVTSTNEFYCAISTISNAVSTDYYEVVGRFAATLSATVSFNWSVPTFTSINLINRPTRETRQLSWTPTFTNLTIGNALIDFKYIWKSTEIIFECGIQFGTTTSMLGAVALSYPVSPINYTATITSGTMVFGHASLRDDSSGSIYPANMAFNGTSSMIVYLANAGSTYLVSATTSNLIPFTWAVNDVIGMHGLYIPNG